jgi:hypothetical protein
MDAATAALVGTGIGATATLAGTFGVSILQGHHERAARKENVIAQLEKERRIKYVNLLTSARELRYIALRIFQHLAARPVGEVDALLTQLSTGYYMIALTAPEETRRLAWDLRESVFELWRMARDHPESEQYQAELARAREKAGLFRSHVTAELNLTKLGRNRFRAHLEAMCPQCAPVGGGSVGRCLCLSNQCCYSRGERRPGRWPSFLYHA